MELEPTLLGLSGVLTAGFLFLDRSLGAGDLSLSKSDATVLSLLGSAVGIALGSAGTKASELPASAILFGVNLLRLKGYNIREENRRTGPLLLTIS